LALSLEVTGLFPSAGPERRKLKIRDAERYGWQPKEMLAQIASIYIHLGRADGQGIFARAIAEDERSFRQEMFAEASKVGCMHSG
jgi:ubiquitin conjugation factor E4 B